MDSHFVGGWIGAAGNALQTGWSKDALRDLAKLEIPAGVLDDMGWLIKGDAATTWAQWFLDAIVDGAKYENQPSLGFSHLYQEVLLLLEHELTSLPIDEVYQLATRIAETSWQEIVYRREIRRYRPTKEERAYLWYSNEPDPRCYLCGYKFNQAAKDRFFGNVDDSAISRPILFDFVRPRGLYVEDLTIQIDHVRPVRAGGRTERENLRLACGWCNRSKSGHMQIYGASTWYSARLRHPLLGWVSIPQPLWVVRLTKFRARCEHANGCSVRLEDHELFISPKRRSGALNPSNCSIFCREHDPWAGVRFIGEKLLPTKRRKT